MYSTDELKKQCLFDFFVTEDSGEQTICHIIVFVGIIFYEIDNLALILAQIVINFLPDFLLVILELLGIFVNLDLVFISNEFIELVVLYFDIDCTKDEFVAQISYALQTSDASLSLSHSSCFVASGCQLSLLSRFKHTW